MLRRVHQYKAVLDQFGLETQRTLTSPVAPPAEEAAPQPETEQEKDKEKEKKDKKKKQQATSAESWHYCEICAEKPRRKKEVIIRRCGHAMCKACLSNLRRVRDLHCPTCRVSFSAPADIQLLVKTTASDLG